MIARLRLAVDRRLRRNTELDLGIEAGQVVCPDRGLTDIENCFICSRFRGRDADRLSCVAATLPPGIATGRRTRR